MTKYTPTTIDIHDIIRDRWSPRGFDQSREVSQSQIHALVEAARWTPSSFNLQPWRFIIWNKHTDSETYLHAYSSIAETNQAWIGHAPVIIAVLADTRDKTGEINSNNSASYDAGAAALSLVFQAQALGLASRQIGGFNRDELRERFNIPAYIRILALIGIGYQSQDNDHLHDDLKQREKSPRERKPLHEIAFTYGLNQPFAAHNFHSIAS